MSAVRGIESSRSWRSEPHTFTSIEPPGDDRAAGRPDPEVLLGEHLFGSIALVVERTRLGELLRGAEVDDAARKVIEDRGYGQYFTHRTGHSIDPRELHGSGPHLDNLETREERLLVPGVGFSIEPGIYIPGKIGMRTEINVYITPGEAVVTPKTYQHDLMIV